MAVSASPSSKPSLLAGKRLVQAKNWGVTGLVGRVLADSNEKAMARMAKLAEGYNKRIAEEEEKTAREILVANVGKIDPKRHLEAHVSDLMSSNIVQCLATMLDTVAF